MARGHSIQGTVPGCHDVVANPYGTGKARSGVGQNPILELRGHTTAGRHMRGGNLAHDISVPAEGNRRLVKVNVGSQYRARRAARRRRGVPYIASIDVDR